MSEGIVPESAAPVAPVVEAPATPTPVIDSIPAPAAPVNWRDSLPADLRENQSLVNIPDVAALAKEHVNVQKLIGVDKIPRPQEDWTPEQFEDFYTKLGRPAKIEDYDLSGFEVPEGLPWDDEFQSAMVGEMHKLGLNTAQVNGMLATYVAAVGGQHQEATGEMDRARDAGITDLRNEWGKSFDAQVAMAKQALNAAAGEGYENLVNIPLADGSVLGDNPAIIRAFAAIGGKMQEHGLVGAVTSRSTLSPAEAQAELNKTYADPKSASILYDENHLEHAAMVKKVGDLTAAAEIG